MYIQAKQSLQKIQQKPQLCNHFRIILINDFQNADATWFLIGESCAPEFLYSYTRNAGRHTMLFKGNYLNSQASVKSD